MFKYPKYHNHKTLIDGITFDSKKESERYLVLKQMQKDGVISHLDLQKKFVIVPKANNNPRTRYYIADFFYIENGKEIIEDVKSPITKKNPVYSLKKALMLYLYPQYEFREV